MARILVIDDDSAIRSVVRRGLERAGHEVTEAPDGDAGLKSFRTRNTDLVITDIIMPEREGVETIMALRKEFPALKIIAMSGGGGGSADFLSIAKKLGARRTLAKPFGHRELLDAVEEVLAEDGAA